MTSRSPRIGKGWSVGLALVLAMAIPAAVNRLRRYQGGARAREYLQDGRLSLALDTLSTLDHRYRHEAEIQYLLGATQRRMGKISLARGAFERATKLGWSRKQLMCQEAMADFQSGDKASEAYLTESLKSGCDDDIAVEL